MMAFTRAKLCLDKKDIIEMRIFLEAVLLAKMIDKIKSKVAKNKFIEVINLMQLSNTTTGSQSIHIQLILKLKIHIRIV